MIFTLNMKVWLGVVACTVAYVRAAPAQASAGVTWDLIDLAAISRMTPQQLELLAEGLAAEEIYRSKRSHDEAVITKKSSSLISKVGLLGQASAGASSFIGAASSKGGEEHQGYSYGEHHEQPQKYDYWSLKKNILNTLFQAVKAITGGVTMLKGQLIKGGGALAASLGKVISAKGDVVTNLGRKIVNSAALSPKKPHHAPAAPVYGPPPPVEYVPASYGPPSAPAHYDHSGPSAPSAVGYPHKYAAHYEGRGKPSLNGLHAGLILLKPVDTDSDHHSAPTESAPLFKTAYGTIKGVLDAVASPGSSHVPPTQGYIYMPPSASHVDEPTASAHYPSAPQHSAPSQDIDSNTGIAPPPLPPYGMTLPAVNSYGEPAQSYDSYPNYVSHHTGPSAGTVDLTRHYPPKSSYSYPKSRSHRHKSLTPEKLDKVNTKIAKILSRTSSENFDLNYNGMMLYKKMLKNPTVSTSMSHLTSLEPGVLSAELMPADPSANMISVGRSSEEMYLHNLGLYDNILQNAILPTPVTDDPKLVTSTSVPETTTTDKPTDKPTENDEDKMTNNERKKKSLKYFLRGNRIVLV